MRSHHRGFHQSKPVPLSQTCDLRPIQNAMRKIEEEFRNRGVKPGGLLMLRARDEIDLIRRCRELKIPVLDIEGYILHPKGGPVHPAGGTEPIPDTVRLNKAPRDPKVAGNCWDLAEQFLQKYLSTDLYFHVTLPFDS
jgi:hypothetical protein